MKRIKDLSGVVHFRGKSDYIALCGAVQFANLLGQTDTMEQTADRVSCPLCAELYCRIKNAPWNEVNEVVLHDATFNAVKEVGDAGTSLH